MSVTERSSRPARELTGYAELAAEIRRLGLLRRRPGFYGGVVAANLLALAAIVTTMVLLRDSWWLLLLAIPFAVVSAQIGFVSHDAGHRQIARRAGPTSVLGLVHANLLSGLSFGWWVGKHNAHHAHPNDIADDPDVHPGVLVFDVESAATRRGVGAWVTRHQAWLFFPLLLLEALSLRVASIRALVGPGIRHRRAEIILLALHFVAYAALLATTLTWPQIVVFVAVHQGLLGVYLGCSFAPNHKGMPALSAEQARDPLLRQVLTSRNIRGGVVTDFLLGGLNYQIEHHLFPSMPRPNLRRAQPVVRRFCADRAVPYKESSALSSYGEVLSHLHAVGAGLRGRTQSADG